MQPAAGGADGGGVFAFSFIEGALVTAVRAGHWVRATPVSSTMVSCNSLVLRFTQVLLDEINLASSDTLQVGDAHAGAKCGLALRHALPCLSALLRFLRDLLHDSSYPRAVGVSSRILRSASLAP